MTINLSLWCIKREGIDERKSSLEEGLTDTLIGPPLMSGLRVVLVGTVSMKLSTRDWLRTFCYVELLAYWMLCVLSRRTRLKIIGLIG